MTIKTFIDGNSTLPVSVNDMTVTGASAGFQVVSIATNITGITVDANIERFNLSDNLSEYKFVTVPGTGIQIKNSADVVIVTIPSLNQTTTIAFADGSAPLVQTGSSSFTLGSQSVPTNTAAPITSVQLGTSFTTVPTTNNNVVPKVTLNSSSTAVNEGQAIILTATSDLVAPTGGLSIPYTLSGSAINGTDYATETTGIIAIAAGQFTGTLTLNTTADNKTEGVETIVATLGNASGASVNTASVAVTIKDTSIAIPVSLSGSTSVNEGEFAVYTVNVDTAVTGTVLTIPYTLSGSTINGGDYAGSALTGVLAIPVGSTSATLTLPVVADLITEGTETIIATLGAPSTGYTFTTGLSSTVTTNVVDTSVNTTTSTTNADVIKLGENHTKFTLNQAKGDSGLFFSGNIYANVISTANFDVIINLQHGDSINLISYQDSNAFVNIPVDSSASLLPEIITQNIFWVTQGWYNYNTKTFQYTLPGIDSLLIYDADPSLSVFKGEAIVLVGVTSTPTATTSGVITF